MLFFYLGGETLEQVSKRYGVLRERVRQLIHAFPEYTAIGKVNRVSRAKLLTLTCSGCGLTYKTQEYHPAKHCSLKCRKIVTRRRWGSARPCPRCAEMRPAGEFYWIRTCRGGQKRPMSMCKKCFKKLSIEWRVKNPEKWKVISRKAIAKYQHKLRLTSMATV